MTLVQPFAVFADVMTSSNAFVVNPDYLIGSASNADPYGIATMELTDEDYLIQPFNSIQTVTNTVNYDGAYAIFYCEDTVNDRMVTIAEPISSDGKASWVVPVGYKVSRYGIRLFKKNLPVSGNYSMQLSYSADTSFSYNRVRVSSARTNQNASNSTDFFDVPYEQASGDFYFDTIVDLGSISYMSIFAWLPEPVASGQLIAGYYDINFTLSSADPDYSTVGAGMAESDYQSDISNQMSNISSSLDSAADNLEYISTSQNLIIQGIDNVIMHISDQLYAFWDQLYNLIHEPTYARLGDILDAIRNLDLEITVEMTEVTNAVNKMNQEVQNKLQQTTDKITGGFDNSVMESEANKLDDSISEYDEAEQSVIQNVNDSLDNFEFDAELGEYQSIVSVISDFLQELYDSSGGFKVLINLSMLLSLAGIVIGIYRFGGGS